jgi:hypothetical protein
MEQLLFIKISHRDALSCKQIGLNLPELYGGGAFSDAAICLWSRQFFMGQEHVEDGRRTGRYPDLGI